MGTKQSLENLIFAQDSLGGLGFTLQSNGVYYKDYVTVNGDNIRISPVFDSGTASAMTHELVAIDVVGHYRLPISHKKDFSLEKVPRECLDDVQTILVKFVPDMVLDKKPEVHIITALCKKCKKLSPSFLKIGDKVTCIKCIGF